MLLSLFIAVSHEFLVANEIKEFDSHLEFSLQKFGNLQESKQIEIINKLASDLNNKGENAHVIANNMAKKMIQKILGFDEKNRSLIKKILTQIAVIYTKKKNFKKELENIDKYEMDFTEKIMGEYILSYHIYVKNDLSECGENNQIGNELSSYIDEVIKLNPKNEVLINSIRTEFTHPNIVMNPLEPLDVLREKAAENLGNIVKEYKHKKVVIDKILSIFIDALNNDEDSWSAKDARDFSSNAMHSIVVKNHDDKELVAKILSAFSASIKKGGRNFNQTTTPLWAMQKILWDMTLAHPDKTEITDQILNEFYRVIEVADSSTEYGLVRDEAIKILKETVSHKNEALADKILRKLTFYIKNSDNSEIANAIRFSNELSLSGFICSVSEYCSLEYRSFIINKILSELSFVNNQNSHAFSKETRSKIISELNSILLSEQDNGELVNRIMKEFSFILRNKDISPDYNLTKQELVEKMRELADQPSLHDKVVSEFNSIIRESKAGIYSKDFLNLIFKSLENIKLLDQIRENQKKQDGNESSNKQSFDKEAESSAD